MRLLNVHSLEFGEFFEREIPPYAILSHRWGEGEVSYKDYRKGRNKDGPGYRKIVEFCSFVRKQDDLQLKWVEYHEDQIDWVWIVTCCIDKRSSAELSEAINSMFEWYKKATVCIAYLADIDSNSSRAQGNFGGSEWFTRGWTLQELLAPSYLIICDRTWQVVGHKCWGCGLSLCSPGQEYGPSLVEKLSEFTKVPQEELTRFDPGDKSRSIAQKMSWAAHRYTTRTEDEAYCLLGIFDVNMPLIYGEGQKAFFRLQEEIIRKSTDQSIFAWESEQWADNSNPGLLADSPRQFANSGDVFIRPEHLRLGNPFSITNNGIEITASLISIKHASEANERLDHCILELNCYFSPGDESSGPPVCIALLPSQYSSGNNHYFPVRGELPVRFLNGYSFKHFGKGHWFFNPDFKNEGTVRQQLGNKRIYVKM